MNVTMDLSKPANGTHLVAGEKATVTVTLKDKLGAALSKDDFATLNLYMYGPQETAKTVTTVKLLNATADRTKTPHHYIDLLKDAGAQIQGNVVKYTLQAVSNEEAGTYTASLWTVKKGTPPVNQAFVLADFQVGTATVEKQIVEKDKCAACHLGTDSGKFYFHHVDPGRSPYGNPSIDSIPVRTCKSCHNNEGYAAFVSPTDGTTRVPDQIVRRVHGVHMGEGLSNPVNTDPKTGLFKDYTEVVFPANVKNCTACHVDDRWKTQPSRLACGACHDNIDWATGKSVVKGKHDHGGGPQANDAACSACHTPDTGGLKPVAVVHKVDPPAFKHTVELSLTPPANGKFYVAGEKPKVTITVKDAKTGAVIDPKTIVEPKDAQKVADNEWRRGYLFVSGPRTQTKPVLTTAAKPNPAKTYASNDFRVLLDPAKEDPKLSRSATAITYQLDDVANLKPGTYTAWVEVMPSAPLGGWALANFQVGTDKQDLLIATNCTSCHSDTRMHGAFFAVQFNPDICKNCHDYERQAPGKTQWTDRNAGFGAGPFARRVHGVHFGRYLDKPKEVHATVDYSEVIFPQDVRNCTKCHDPKGSPRWKENPSRIACLACHDKDSAISHASLMTQDATPADPWSGDEKETCNVCHGPGKEFSPDKVHNIAKPYKPPYPREPETR